jgi:hypothetical protein
MEKVIGFGLIVVLVIASVFFVPKYFYFDDIDLVKKHGIREWVGHSFAVASDGNVEFTDDGFKVIGRGIKDDGLVTTKLVDINMNQNIKVRVVADLEGKYQSGEWSEFAIYLAHNDDSFFDDKIGIALMGSRDNVAQSSAPRAGENVRDEFSFSWFSVENTGKEIIFEDSNGRVIIDDLQDRRNSRIYEELDDSEMWNLRINSHVKGVGETSLKIREIIVRETL